MSLQLSKNATCVLTDADIYSRTQNAKMALNLCSNLPGSDIEGDRIMIITSANEPAMRAYSAGGEAGKIYGGVDGVVVDNDNDTVGLNEEVWGILDSYTETSANFLTSADIADFATESFVTDEIEQATSAYITSADVPEPPTIAFENNGVLDTDYDGIKITNDSVGNEHVNLKKGESWYNHGLLVPTSPGNDKYLTTTSAGHLSWENQPEIPEVPTIKDFIAGNGINISATSADVTISVDNAIFNGYATESFVTNEIEQATSAFITSADVPEVKNLDPYGTLSKGYDGSITNVFYGAGLKEDEGAYHQGRQLKYQVTSNVTLYRIADLRRFISNDSRIRLVCDTYHPTGITPVWFPIVGTSVYTQTYLKSRSTISWTNVTYAYNSFTTSGSSRSYSGNIYYTSIIVPFSSNLDFDDTLFEKVGNWSSITNPIYDKWALGLLTSSDTWWQIDGGHSEDSSKLSIAYQTGAFNINLKSNGGISCNGYNGLFLDRPVPAYDNTDEGKVLGVTSGATDWVNLPDVTDMATQTWTAQNYFPIDGLQVVGSSAEASGANIIYIVSGSNA